MTFIPRVPQKELDPRRIAPSSIVWAVEYLENPNRGHKKELSSSLMIGLSMKALAMLVKRT